MEYLCQISDPCHEEGPCQRRDSCQLEGPYQVGFCLEGVEDFCLSEGEEEEDFCRV